MNESDLVTPTFEFHGLRSASDAHRAALTAGVTFDDIVDVVANPPDGGLSADYEAAIRSVTLNGSAPDPAFVLVNMAVGQTDSPLVIKDAAGVPSAAFTASSGLTVGSEGIASDTRRKTRVYSSGLAIIQTNGNAYGTAKGETIASRIALSLYGATDLMLMADGGRLMFGAAKTAPTDSVLTAWKNGFFPGGDLVDMWVDESASKLMFRVRFNGGTFKTGEVALA